MPARGVVAVLVLRQQICVASPKDISLLWHFNGILTRIFRAFLQKFYKAFLCFLAVIFREFWRVILRVFLRTVLAAFYGSFQGPVCGHFVGIFANNFVVSLHGHFEGISWAFCGKQSKWDSTETIFIWKSLFVQPFKLCIYFLGAFCRHFAGILLAFCADSIVNLGIFANLFMGTVSSIFANSFWGITASFQWHIFKHSGGIFTVISRAF